MSKKIDSFTTFSTSEPDAIWTLPAIEAQLNFLQGEVLTAVDAASFADRQCKALKDIIKKSFRDRMRHMNMLSGAVTKAWDVNEAAEQKVYTEKDAG